MISIGEVERERDRLLVFAQRPVLVRNSQAVPVGQAIDHHEIPGIRTGEEQPPVNSGKRPEIPDNHVSGQLVVIRPEVLRRNALDVVVGIGREAAPGDIVFGRVSTAHVVARLSPEINAVQPDQVRTEVLALTEQLRVVRKVICPRPCVREDDAPDVAVLLRQEQRQPLRTEGQGKVRHQVLLALRDLVRSFGYPLLVPRLEPQEVLAVNDRGGIGLVPSPQGLVAVLQGQIVEGERRHLPIRLVTVRIEDVVVECQHIWMRGVDEGIHVGVRPLSDKLIEVAQHIGVVRVRQVKPVLRVSCFSGTVRRLVTETNADAVVVVSLLGRREPIVLIRRVAAKRAIVRVRRFRHAPLGIAHAGMERGIVKVPFIIGHAREVQIVELGLGKIASSRTVGRHPGG